MDIKVHSVHFKADQKLLDFVNEKVTKLQLFFDNIIAGEVFLRLDKSSEKENKVAEVKILMPGRELFAKKQCKSFEEAADSAVEALRKQVKKHKEKIAS
ncbi:MAG: ribosome-associated translation inhibitor RaiA [Bacteroidota bacterium]|jgi:putative sigma-54 modulation protein|nr:MAG: ribosomal subunit interface protein [Candidatus Fluviicola riflensis]MDH4473731.1 ribosome-associated translation inhibitor RaiA [Fluviicola sp.]OGS76655.1 MAG: ribosomal subunit interface protein [Candidatus Fluviicola riflensis]OGS82990.1 MAG: ribosomal subunit interface protein [Fluviicola sp. RIFCSPHIGHO2_01_FULL_43_53]OGS88386.1 MAG: ribosomal subunit interface protein [Fluviicola sp. RIFCSPHIGHO2_12_FULL_43_24]